MCSKIPSKGFSLIELAVTITIIGLILAGIATGTKLLGQAELRGYISQMDQFRTDFNSFRVEYNALPGDMKDASVYFAGCASGGAGNVNCNGNGDGFITFNMGNAWDGDQVGDELPKVFRHLNLSGINTNGGNTVFGGWSSFGGTGLEGYFPKGRLKNSTMFISTVDAGGTANSVSGAGTIARDGSTTALISNFAVNQTVIAGIKVGTGARIEGAMDATSAHNIDRKIDDGDASGAAATGANTGKLRTITDTTGANACVATNNYNISQTATTCVIQMLIR